jgi:hypothetical protein
MALADAWPVAAGLVLAERVGRAMRKPTVEAMLSYTTEGAKESKTNSFPPPRIYMKTVQIEVVCYQRFQKGQ